MADERVGFFSPLARPECWQDNTAMPEGWFMKELIKLDSAAPPAGDIPHMLMLMGIGS